MFDTLHKLRGIVQEVGAAADLEAALKAVVTRVKQAMAADLCCIYLTDRTDDYNVLMAADGLNPKSIGNVRMAPGEGLAGLVADRQEPVNLEDGSIHPRFRFFPETGEEIYHAFLGVPIIHYRKVLGVLIVQHRSTRFFDSDEEAFFITVAAQLAGTIHEALRDGGIRGLLGQRKAVGAHLQGIPSAPGVIIGTVKATNASRELFATPDRQAEDRDREERAFGAAIQAVQQDLQVMQQQMGDVLVDDVRVLFDVYAMMLADETFFADVTDRIRAGNWAPGALRETISDRVSVFEAMEDSYLSARAEDIRDLGQRILGHLLHRKPTARSCYPDHCILAGDEISVGDIAEVPIDNLAGILCRRGSVLSHTAVLARALGIPAVMGLDSLPHDELDGCQVILDGYLGRVFLEPEESVIQSFRGLIEEERDFFANLEGLRDLPAQSTDGAHVGLYVNTGLLSEFTPALSSGAEGVGLYRTEFPFLVRESFPTEEEQFAMYRDVLQRFAPKPVTMRTLDIGGDKILPYFPMEDANPFLGWRGIRVTLDHPDIFLTQIRAMLRANTNLENLHLVFPMVSQISELEGALGLLERAHSELVEEGWTLARPPIGVMIEVPSAVFLADALARRVDFLSIGTNDLTQYLLAVDRNNSRIAQLYDSFHPAVLDAINSTVRAAHHNRKPVSVCGEMSGDPMAVILLLGMGVDALSTSASSLTRVKWVIRNFSRKRAGELVRQCLRMESGQEVRSLLEDVLENHGLGGLIRPGR